MFEATSRTAPYRAGHSAWRKELAARHSSTHRVQHVLETLAL